MSGSPRKRSRKIIRDLRALGVHVPQRIERESDPDMRVALLLELIRALPSDGQAQPPGGRRVDFTDAETAGPSPAGIAKMRAEIEKLDLSPPADLPDLQQPDDIPAPAGDLTKIDGQETDEHNGP